MIQWFFINSLSSEIKKSHIEKVMSILNGYIQKSRLFEFHILEQSKKVDFSGSKKVDFLFLAKSKKVDFCYPKK